VYGAAYYRYSEKTPSNFYLIEDPKYLIKFRYDLRKGRCESKDLSLKTGDLPQSVEIHFVKANADAEHVEENALPDGLRVLVKSGERPEFAVEVAALSAAEIESHHHLTEKSKSFSAKVPAQDLQLLISPYESLQRTLLSEINFRIEKCRVSKVCDSIKMAVSILSDPPLIEAISRAKTAGLPVEVMVNGAERGWGEVSPGKPPLKLEPSPWFWQRGNRYFGPPGYLPMHTKFTIFGDDLVVSSNRSYDFTYFYRTREAAVLYRNKDIVKMYNEIFTMLRTSLYYPLYVDVNDPVQILFYAERPRRYSASDKTPYIEIRTNEGLRSSGYGLVLDLLKKHPGRFSLAMSPISNGCYTYRTRSCFYDLLVDRAKQGDFSLVLNGWFFLLPEVLARTSDPKQKPDELFTSRAFQESPSFRSKLKEIKDLFPKRLENLRLFYLPQENTSTHHERYGTLGDDIFLGGSANFAFPRTLNTIEIIRSPEMVSRLQKEEATWDEPYLIVENRSFERERLSYKTCEFVFERDVLHREPAKQKEFSIKNIATEFKRRYGSALDDSFTMIEPTYSEEIFESRAAWDSLSFREKPLEPVIRSYSSYFCLKSTRDGGTYVVRGD
jgi:hypothetical protein